MEPIKIQVEINLSESAQSFLSNIFAAAEKPAPKKSTSKKSVAEEKVAEKPVAEEKVAEKPVAEEKVAEKPVAEEKVAKEPVAEEKVAKEPVAEEPVAEEKVAVTLEDLRTLLAEKVSSHRSEIKDKLTELNSPSLTRLAESAYQEMYDFLTKL